MKKTVYALGLCVIPFYLSLAMQEPANRPTNIHDFRAWPEAYENSPLLYSLVDASIEQETSAEIITNVTEHSLATTPEEYAALVDTVCPPCTAQTIRNAVEFVALYHRSPSEKIGFLLNTNRPKLDNKELTQIVNTVLNRTLLHDMPKDNEVRAHILFTLVAAGADITPTAAHSALNNLNHEQCTFFCFPERRTIMRFLKKQGGMMDEAVIRQDEPCLCGLYCDALMAGVIPPTPKNLLCGPHANVALGVEIVCVNSAILECPATCQMCCAGSIAALCCCYCCFQGLELARSPSQASRIYTALDKTLKERKIEGNRRETVQPAIPMANEF